MNTSQNARVIPEAQIEAWHESIAFIQDALGDVVSPEIKKHITGMANAIQTAKTFAPVVDAEVYSINHTS